jgi:hypothetical protein
MYLTNIYVNYKFVAKWLSCHMQMIINLKIPHHHQTSSNVS